ncbi:MAG TPA: protein kinase [Polyangiaceae bacterium]|nr:protein kinase [Polyangiaceae bacterium]
MAVGGSTRPETWAPGMVVPGTVYRVIRPLGSGGMGDVYEVEHELLGLRRALKVLGRRMAGRDDLAERLRIEARALAGLRHPNLVEVHDLGVSSDGRVFYAMEILTGATLRELLERHGSFKVGQACDVAAQLLDALGAAHGRGMVHRDVKPENIFVQRNGVLKLLDFGVAKAVFGASPTAPKTAAGVAVGTPRYMAPEQAEGKPVDPRTDLYCVGLVLWEMLTGKNPFAELDHLAAAVASVLQGVPPLEDVGFGHLPESVRAAVRKATRQKPDERYGDAASFASELRAFRRSANATPPPPTAVTASRAGARLPPGTVTRLDPVPVGAATEAPAIDYGALGALTRPPGGGAAGRGTAFAATMLVPATMIDGVEGDFRSAPTRTSFGPPTPAQPATGAEASPTPLPVSTERRGAPAKAAARTVPLPFWLLLPVSAALSSAVTAGLLRPSLTAARGPCPPGGGAMGVAAAAATAAEAAMPATAAPQGSAAVVPPPGAAEVGPGAPPPSAAGLGARPSAEAAEPEPKGEAERRAVKGPRERAAGRPKAGADAAGKAMPGPDFGQ